MDRTLLISKISINKKKHEKSERINYTLLNEKRIHHDGKKMFTYPVELTILLITIYHS